MDNFGGKIREYLKLVSIPIAFASLCCLSPLVLFVFGLASLSFAVSLSDTLYGTYKWVFRSIGLILLGVFLILYFKKKGVCTLNQAKRRKNEIINTILIVLIFAILGYIFFLYVVVHYLGVWVGVWG